ncbi:MAG: hypothetical protein JWQ69_4382 [Pseudomonas sp.]|jgi:hypothetical protein|nr:hypothetical protein [Pseudomonas sp.]
MKLISKPFIWVLFTALFFCVVLPIGYLVRALADPHRLVIRKRSESYFNRLSTHTRTTLRDKESIRRNVNA